MFVTHKALVRHRVVVSADVKSNETTFGHQIMEATRADRLQLEADGGKSQGPSTKRWNSKRTSLLMFEIQFTPPLGSN